MSTYGNKKANALGQFEADDNVVSMLVGDQPRYEGLPTNTGNTQSTCVAFDYATLN